MNPESYELPAQIQELMQLVTTYVGQPWFAYQIIIIVSFYVFARLLRMRLEPRLEQRARQVKAHPELLRLIVAGLRRMDLLLYILMLASALAVMRGLTWPSRSYLIYVALMLALAWLVISVLSRAIHGRTLGRIVAAGIWVYAAISIFDLNEPVADFLENLGFSAGEFASIHPITGLVCRYAGTCLPIKNGRPKNTTASTKFMPGPQITTLVLSQTEREPNSHGWPFKGSSGFSPDILTYPPRGRAERRYSVSP